MECPHCYVMMMDEDDLGDGNRGWECPICHRQIADREQPCPDDPEGEPCYFVDNEYGQPVCITCGRDEP